MNVDRIEKVICSAARLYREINKPLLSSRIDMTHELYADEESDEPMMTVDVKGEPRVKLLDLVVIGSAALIFLTIVSRVLGFLRRR